MSQRIFDWCTDRSLWGLEMDLNMEPENGFHFFTFFLPHTTTIRHSLWLTTNSFSPTMSSSLLLVNDLKKSLSKELGESCDVERARDILNQLDQCEMTLQILSDSLIGTVVSKFKTNEDSNVAAKAKSLIKKWKQLAKQSQTSSSATDVKVTKAAHSSPPTKKVESKMAATSTKETSAPAIDALEPQEWDNLPPLRKNTAKKLLSVFDLSKESLGSADIHESAIKSLTTDRASEVELASHEYAKGNKDAYLDKIRSLVFNLKKNTQLRENVLFGGVSSESLVKMSPNELATDEKIKEREAQVAFLKDSRRLDWEQANEAKVNEMCGIKGDLLKASLFECGRCKSHKTTSTQKQTRSADEPMTVFVLCLNCGNRWKC